ncbi:MAG TPA: trehalose-6-phosphate synthase [Mycobacteriales bacterium]|nr:trehalose-6-phosphate synthase [Mycobacteriales bacterium]
MAKIVIASNRGPIAFHRDDDGRVTESRGGGGLVSGLAAVRSEGATVWVCAALSDDDRAVAASAPAGRLDRAGHDTGGAVRMLPIEPATYEAAYNVVSNTTLWYLHHGLIDNANPPDYENAEWRRAWTGYVDYNTEFADAVAEEAAPGARVLAQDYHLTLLPELLRSRRPDVRIGLFTHTPWSTPENFALLPDDVARALLTGMLGADTLGFHSPRWAKDFIACCARLLDVDHDDSSVRHGGRTTAVRIYPLGVDPEPLLERAAQPDVAADRDALKAELADRKAIVRVDRTEPSKNLARGLEAFRRLLDDHPEHRQHVVHVAMAYPSRQDIADYRDYTAYVEDLAKLINAELGTAGWTPVELQVRNDYAESLAVLGAGDVVLVNPVRDGMNLVAKEAIVLTDDAVLVLSREAGAADELGGAALLVDPYDVAATAQALHDALVMPEAERTRRHAELRKAAIAMPPHEWLAAQLADL